MQQPGQFLHILQPMGQGHRLRAEKAAAAVTEMRISSRRDKQKVHMGQLAHRHGNIAFGDTTRLHERRERKHPVGRVESEN